MNPLTIVATSIGTLVALFPLAFIAYINAGGMYHQLKLNAARKREKSSADAPAHACHIDADCPPGHICMNGVCLPQDA